jgi:hypothetical protein
MTGLGSHELSAQAPKSRGRTRRPAHGSDPFAVIRARAHTQQQGEACERFLRYVVRCEAVDGERVDRTWRQLAKGLGKPTHGLTDRQCRNRYRGAIRNTIDYLVAWGLLEGREALYEPALRPEAPHGEGRCIVIVLKAGVAQSVRAAQSGISPPRRRPPVACQSPPGGDSAGSPQHFFSGDVCTPSREGDVDVDVAVKQRYSQASVNDGASARVGPCKSPAHERFLLHAASRRSLIHATARASLWFVDGGLERVGSDLADDPQAQVAPVVPLARILTRFALPSVSPAISPKRRAQLEAAAARLDHYSGAGPGEWIRVATLILDGWAHGGCPGFCTEPPRSLGALALELRREANMRRHFILRYGRPGGRLRIFEGAIARQDIKRRRMKRRYRPGVDQRAGWRPGDDEY